MLTAAIHGWSTCAARAQPRSGRLLLPLSHLRRVDRPICGLPIAPRPLRAWAQACRRPAIVNGLVRLRPYHSVVSSVVMREVQVLLWYFEFTIFSSVA